jgi:hypothetical protein
LGVDPDVAEEAVEHVVKEFGSDLRTVGLGAVRHTSSVFSFPRGATKEAS